MVNLIDEYYTKMRQIWIRKIFHNFEYDNNNNNNNILTIFMGNFIPSSIQKKSLFNCL